MSKSPVAKRLKEARILAGLSQKKLGIAAGMDEFSASARMNQYETGKHTPDYSTLTSIAKVLKLPVAYFYAVGEELAEIISAWSRMDKKQAKLFLNKIHRITKDKIL